MSDKTGSWVDKNGTKWCGCGDEMPKELVICVTCQYVEDMIAKDKVKHEDEHKA